MVEFNLIDFKTGTSYRNWVSISELLSIKHLYKKSLFGKDLKCLLKLYLIIYNLYLLNNINTNFFKQLICAPKSRFHTCLMPIFVTCTSLILENFKELTALLLNLLIVLKFREEAIFCS